MPALRQPKLKLTPDEYLELEEQAEFKSEYSNGVMIPLHGEPPKLAGATINHVQIVSNLTEIVSPLLKKQGCRTFSTDLKVWVEKSKKLYYPDLIVVCGAIEFYQKRRDAIRNPLLLIEILSDSTEAKDRAEKFWAYQTLESFQEYILVSQNNFVVEQFHRQSDNSWRYLATSGLDSSVTFESIGQSFGLKEIYDLVEFEGEEL